MTPALAIIATEKSLSLCNPVSSQELSPRPLRHGAQHNSPKMVSHAAGIEDIESGVLSWLQHANKTLNLLLLPSGIDDAVPCSGADGDRCHMLLSIRDGNLPLAIQ